jgi:cytochrome P450
MTSADARAEIRGYHAVLAAAKNTTRYSSDLQGDRDVRDYKQIPLELDAPDHTAFRNAVQPLFMADAIAPKMPRFQALAVQLIADIDARGGGDITTDLALPYVIGCLTIVYERPQDYDEWLSWGPDVWLADAHAAGEVTPESQRAQRERRFDVESQRSGDALHSYLARVFDDAEARALAGEPERDVWDTIARLVVNDRTLTRDEMFGIASVLLAGGRDTVIKLITGLVWHLVKEPADREYLTGNPDAVARTIAELGRFLSPLAKMERIERGPDGEALDYVILNYVSANHDAEAWGDPEVIDIHRERKPNAAFGMGRHSCMGKAIAEHETRAFLSVLLRDWPDWVFSREPEIEWVIDGEGDDAIRIIDRFTSVPVRRATASA